MLVLTGLLEGAALLALLSAATGGLQQIYLPSAAVIVMLGSAMAILWLRYVPATRNTTHGEVEAIAGPILNLGLLMPALIVAISATAPDEVTQALLVGVAATAIVLAGAIWKFTVIVRAAHFQGHQIPGRGAA